MSTSLIIGSGSPLGLFTVSFDPVSGALAHATPVLSLAGATFVIANADHSRLYATIEGANGVASISVDPVTGQLTLLNEQPSGGRGPCHLALDRTGRTLIVACYSSGTISAFPILPDGAIGDRNTLHQHEGTGPDQPRQDSPHAHSITVSADNHFCYACDLTLDQIIVYRIGPNPGDLLAPSVSSGRTPPGHGPRHAKLSPDGRFLYVLNELIGSVTAFTVNPTDGSLTALKTTTSLPSDHSGFNNSAEILLHPQNDEWVYASNRGPNSIALFHRDRDSGQLALQSITPTGGDHPRNFNISPDGRWLVCANRFANELVTFAIDPANGALQPTPHRLEIPDPCCVAFRP